MPCDACNSREPQMPAWHMLLAAYRQGALTTDVFHDAFLETYRYARDSGLPKPDAIQDLMSVVSSYAPKASKDRPADVTETELLTAVDRALVRLAAPLDGDLRP